MKTKNIKIMKSLINISEVKMSNRVEFLHSIIYLPVYLKRPLMFLILFGISTLGAFAQNLNNPNKEGSTWNPSEYNKWKFIYAL